MNCLLGFMILAARDRDSDFSWIVPLVFVVIWVLGGIGKVYGSYKEGKQQRDSAQTDQKMRYKPIGNANVSSSSPKHGRTMPQAAPVPQVREVMPVAVSMPAKAKRKLPETVASLKKAMRDAMEETYAQQSKSLSPKPSRAPVRSQRQSAVKNPPVSRAVTKELVRESQPRQEESVLSGLLQRENIRKAIIYSEIIGKPLAFRET